MKKYPWINSYPDHIAWDKTYNERPIFELFDERADQFSDHKAIDFLSKTYSYAELKLAINQCAEGLQKLGVKKGVHVGLYLPNCPQHVIAYYAILKAGGTVVNFSPLYSLRELEHQVKDSDTEILITLNLEILYPNAKELIGCGKLKHLIIGKLTDALPFPKKQLFSLLKRKEIASITWDESHTDFNDLLKNKGNVKAPKIDLKNDLAVLQYTGGTTGVPKGASLSHANISINAQQAADWCKVDPLGEGKTLAVLPFFHVFAMTACMNMSFLLGSTIIMLPRFDVKQTLQNIHKKKASLLLGVPAILNAISNYEDVGKYTLSSLKICVSGGAPLPHDTQIQFEKITGCEVIEGYGLSESSPVACVSVPFAENPIGSIGLPLAGTVIEIEDIENKGTFLGTNKIGELCIRGPQVMLGYYNRKDATKKVIDILKNGERRLHTGDIAKIDENGYIFIVDRLKEMIIVNGFKIYPRNVEEALYEYPDMLEAAVIGVPDEQSGESVKAYIVLKPSATYDEAGLKEFLKSRIGKHEMPREFEIMESLPKTMIGKIDKKILKESI